MALAPAPVRSVDRATPQPMPQPTSRHIAVCALRGLGAAFAGVLLVAGVGLLIWAVTPESGPPGPVLRGAIAALGAANFLPPSVGGIQITLTPLLLTGVCFGAVASAANRGNRPEVGIGVELLGALAAGLIYGAAVTAVVTALAPAGADNVGRVWAPALLGALAGLAGVTVRGHRWRTVLRTSAPKWVPVAAGAGGAGLLLLLSGGAVGVAASLVSSFGTAVDLSSIAAPSVGAGVGMVVLGLAYLPNAMVAGAGYAAGIGFQIGAGTYSPLGSTTIDLPTLPLLAAVPDSGGRSPAGLLLMIFPLAAATVIGRQMVRRLDVRRDRMLGALTASLSVGCAMAVLAAVAGGGVNGSPWAHLGVPALGVGAVLAGALGAISVTIAAVAGWGSVPWARHRPESVGAGVDEGPVVDEGRGQNVDADSDAGADADAGADSDTDATAVADAGSDPDPVADGNSDPDPVADANSDPDAVVAGSSDPDAVVDAGRPDTGADTDTGADAVSDADAMAEADAPADDAAGIDPPTATVAARKPDLESEPQSELPAKRELQSEPVPGPQPQSELDPRRESAAGHGNAPPPGHPARSPHPFPGTAFAESDPPAIG